MIVNEHGNLETEMHDERLTESFSPLGRITPEIPLIIWMKIPLTN